MDEGIPDLKTMNTEMNSLLLKILPCLQTYEFLVKEHLEQMYDAIVTQDCCTMECLLSVRSSDALQSSLVSQYGSEAVHKLLNELNALEARITEDPNTKWWRKTSPGS